MARAPASPPEMIPVGRAAMPLEDEDEAPPCVAVAEAALDEADASLLERDEVRLLASDEAETTATDAWLTMELAIGAAVAEAAAAAYEVMKYCWTPVGRARNQDAVVEPATSLRMALTAAAYRGLEYCYAQINLKRGFQSSPSFYEFVQLQSLKQTCLKQSQIHATGQKLKDCDMDHPAGIQLIVTCCNLDTSRAWLNNVGKSLKRILTGLVARI